MKEGSHSYTTCAKLVDTMYIGNQKSLARGGVYLEHLLGFSWQMLTWPFGQEMMGRSKSKLQSRDEDPLAVNLREDL